jgi:mitochondrial import receptor subunit TOM22
LGERLWALTEMFPDSLRSGTEKIVNTAGKVILGKILVRYFHTYHELLNNPKPFTETYLFACTSTWYVSTTAALLLMPVLFETERIQMEEAQKNHSKQVSVLIIIDFINKEVYSIL